MNDHEMSQVLDEMAKTRKLSVFERSALTSAMIDMTMAEASLLVTKAHTIHTHVSAATIMQMRGRDSGNARGAAEWDIIVERIIQPGIMAECLNTRQPVPAELFPSAAAHAAWRQAHPKITGSAAHIGRKAFLDAHQHASRTVQATEAPAIEAGTPAELGIVGRRLDGAA